MSSATQVRPMVPVLPGISGATRTIFMSGIRPGPAGQAFGRKPRRTGAWCDPWKARPWSRRAMQQRATVRWRQVSAAKVSAHPRIADGLWAQPHRPFDHETQVARQRIPGVLDLPDAARQQRADPPHQTGFREPQQETAHLLPAVADERRESVEEQHLRRSASKREIMHRGVQSDPLRPLGHALPEGADASRDAVPATATPTAVSALAMRRDRRRRGDSAPAR
jgi:hypothetical protein